MPPQGENTALLDQPVKAAPSRKHRMEETNEPKLLPRRYILLMALALMALCIGMTVNNDDKSLHDYSGAYMLVERQVGQDFFKYYDFYDGPDSEGSAGYNMYVGEKRAIELGIANVTDEREGEFVYMSSTPTKEGPRESVRLEGKRRYNSGLFILDVRHMPAGCGQWPAFWLTDEDSWPNQGEIDIVEGINYQSVAKTAMHTSDRCSMYAHVSPFDKTGYWDSASGIPNTWTGKPDFDTQVEADNCWVMAPHQWANQGCVAISDQNETIGAPLNANDGGVYVLEWDPSNLHIRSWVFTPRETMPDNLVEAMQTSGNKDKAKRVKPDPSGWNLPYAYFAVGPTTGCSSDHFKDMRIVFNLAFCGTVSGNRFFRDCPAQAKNFNVDDDPIRSCNAYIESQPDELNEAYWKVGGVYVYERE